MLWYQLKMIPIFFTLTLVAVFSGITKGEVCDAENGPTCDGLCGISGNWTNQLGSMMTLDCQPSSSTVGFLSGSYRSAVGQAADFYQLSGRYTVVGTDYILGFSVAWNNDVKGNSKSATSWTGVYYADQQKITTFWILTSYTKPADMWGNSQIGKDVFVRLIM